MSVSPSTNNYYLGKGVLKFDRWADGVPTGLVDIGNAPAFSVSMSIETLEHFSSRAGIKSKDLSVVTAANPIVKFTLDEHSRKNMALAMMGAVAGNKINVLSDTVVEGELQFIGANTIGTNWNVVFWRVKVKPSGDIGLITDDWGTMEFEGEVLDYSAVHPTEPFGYFMDMTGS